MVGQILLPNNQGKEVFKVRVDEPPPRGKEDIQVVHFDEDWFLCRTPVLRRTVTLRLAEVSLCIINFNEL